MLKETTEKDIKLVENIGGGLWAVRLFAGEKADENGEATGIYLYEEALYRHIPQIEEVRKFVNSWINMQIDSRIKCGYSWKGSSVLLNMENQFNYKSVFDLAAMIESSIDSWDKENPDMAGVDYTTEETTDDSGEIVQVEVATGRPKSILPVSFKFGNDSNPSYYTFDTFAELKDFYTSCLLYIQSCYNEGWKWKDNFDYTPYEEAINLEYERAE